MPTVPLPPLLPMSRGRRALFTSVYLTLLTAITLVGVELLSRGLFEPETRVVYSYNTNEIVFDPTVGWRGRRNFSGEVLHARYPVPIALRINADGFRDDSWDEKLLRAAQQGTKKILLLGDSIVYGWANPVDGRLGEQLLARYRLAGRRVEIFNAGGPGWGPHNELRVLPELLARVRPDEVVLLFCWNDYADAVLPYNYRFPFRVYQPFYDTHAQLLFNATVPRRPSLVMRDTPLGGLRLWYAIDQLRYALENVRYARYGIPSAAPVSTFADIIAMPGLRARFSYVELTMLAEYARMAELSRAAGAGFTFLPTLVRATARETIDGMLRAKLEARGVRYLPCLGDTERYGPWTFTLLDGHPNFIWAWIMAGALYGHLEGRPYGLDLAEMPQTRDIPSKLDLGITAACARFLSLDWRSVADGGRSLGGMASFVLGNASPGLSRLEIEGSAPRPAQLLARTIGDRDLCRFTLTPRAASAACTVDTTGMGPILFASLLPESGLDPARLPVINRVRLRPAAAKVRFAVR